MIVAFGHRRYTGKDTCARYMEAELTVRTSNTKILRRGFAHKLYDICNQLYGWAGFQSYAHYNHHPHAKEEVLQLIGKSPRTILIEVGNKIREVYAETWIETLLARAGDYDYVLIPDLRYENEAKIVKNSGGLLVKVVRPGVEEYDDVADSNLANYDEWDFTIVNDGGLNQLYIKVQAVLEAL